MTASSASVDVPGMIEVTTTAVSPSPRWAPLSRACMMGDEDRVRETIDNDPDSARRLDDARCSPLGRAARFEHTQVTARATASPPIVP